jgi:hypothetical protein
MSKRPPKPRPIRVYEWVPRTITPSSGCVFFDLSVPCEQNGCVVCPAKDTTDV